MSTMRPLFALLSGLLFSFPVSAAEVVGIVARVDLEKKELLLDGRGAARGEALMFVVDNDTQVLFGKRAASLADVPFGRRVHVLYEVRDSRRVARIVRVNGPKPTAPATPADKGAITGVLRRVALTDREVVVIGPGSMGKETETTVAVPEAARIAKDGKAATLEMLKENDMVRIVAEMRDGKLTAIEIQVGAATAKKSDLVPKIRLGLQIADLLLKQMEKREP